MRIGLTRFLNEFTTRREDNRPSLAHCITGRPGQSSIARFEASLIPLSRSRTFFPRGPPGLSFNARIERPPFHRGRLGEQ